MKVTIVFSSNGNICGEPTELDLAELSSWAEFCSALERFAMVVENLFGQKVDKFFFFINDRPIDAATIKNFYKPKWSWSAGLQVGFFAWLLGFFVSLFISNVFDIPINNVGFDWLTGIIAAIAGIWAARNLGGKL